MCTFAQYRCVYICSVQPYVHAAKCYSYTEWRYSYVYPLEY